MSKTHNTQPFPAEAMTAFAADYHRHREDGATVHAAYYAAKSDAIREERRYPSLMTLLRRLNPERYAKPARTERRPEASALETPSDLNPDAGDQSTVLEEITRAGAATILPISEDRRALAIALLRCYRYRSEEAIDAMTDRLFPDLAGEEE